MCLTHCYSIGLYLEQMFCVLNFHFGLLKANIETGQEIQEFLLYRIS